MLQGKDTNDTSISILTFPWHPVLVYIESFGQGESR